MGGYITAIKKQVKPLRNRIKPPDGGWNAVVASFKFIPKVSSKKIKPVEGYLLYETNEFSVIKHFQKGYISIIYNSYYYKSGRSYNFKASSSAINQLKRITKETFEGTPINIIQKLGCVTLDVWESISVLQLEYKHPIFSRNYFLDGLD